MKKWHLMSSIVYKLIWYLINTIIAVVENLMIIYLYTLRKIENVRLSFDYTQKNNNDNSKKSLDIEFIQSNIYHVKKIPKHFVLILNENYFDLNKLVNIVKWSQAAGIKYISFYDYQGVFESDYIELSARVQTYQTASTTDKDRANKIMINYVTQKHGIPEIVSLCQQFCYAAKANQLASAEVSIALIDKKLRESLNNLPDPDVAVYFNNVCGTYGLLPWQIRLTEFYYIGEQSSLNIFNFMNVLNKYSKCEQRFGK